MMWMSQRPYKQLIVSLLILSLIMLSIPIIAVAEETTNETVVTLGGDLSEEQQTLILNEMGVDEDVRIIYVANEEEHRYLGEYISAETIGRRANSSAKITLTAPDTGINVETNNIDWVTKEMYANALITAGVTDADVYVTAPFEVSGTAGLTGLIKAFEVATDHEISEEQKQAANEEMVRTAELGDKIGATKAAELIRRLKEALADAELETDEDYRNLILQIAAELNVELNDQDVDALVHLLKRLKGLNINWGQVGDQLKNIRDNLDDILNREETRNILRQFLDFLVSIIESIKGLFSS